jgi:hypothetical protein
MKDKLPLIHESYDDDFVFNEIERQKSEQIDFIDLREKLIEESKTKQIYYKTDHHWTSEGAFVAYNEYCKKNGLTIPSRENFKIESFNNFFGTNYSKSAFWLSKPDMIQTFNPSGDFTVDIFDGNGKEKISQSLFFKEHLEENDKYPVFLDGNHSFVKITNSSVPEGKLLVVKDSFGHCLVPFLSQLYHEIYMIDLRYYKKSVADLVNSEGIENIILVYGVENFIGDSNLKWIKK